MKKTCQRCDYEWDYKGELENPTCPSCGYKIRLSKIRL